MTIRQLEALGWQIRLDILNTWKQNKAPIAGALSVVDLYMVLFLKTLNRENWATDPSSVRIIPKTTSANALYVTLKYAGLAPLSPEDGPQEIPPVVHKDLWPGDVDGTLTRNFGQAVGMALYYKYNQMDNQVIAFISEGDIQAGVEQPAKLAVEWGLDNLTVVLDANQVQSSRPVKGADPSLERDQSGRYSHLKTAWKNYGWAYHELDGHNYANIQHRFAKIGSYDRPLLLVAKTVKGRGIPFIEQEPTRFSHRLTPEEHLRAVSHVTEQMKQRSVTPVKPMAALKVGQRSNRQILRLPLIPANPAGTPLEAFGEFAEQLRDLNSSNVFFLNTDNPLPFDPGIATHNRSYRSQHIQIGVNEKLAVNVARGMANAGAYPVYSSPATHIIIGAEDLMHCALSQEPVLFVGTFPGIDLSHWGPSHSSNRDMNLFAFAGVGIFQAATAADAWSILSGIYENPGAYLPAYVRLPSREFMRENHSKLEPAREEDAFANGFYWYQNPSRSASDVLFVTSGVALMECLDAAAELEKREYSTKVVNIINLTSINRSLINQLAEGAKIVIACQDADPTIMQNLLWSRLTPEQRPKVTALGVSDFNDECYTRESVLSRHGIDALSLASLATQKLGATGLLQIER